MNRISAATIRTFVVTPQMPMPGSLPPLHPGHAFFAISLCSRHCLCVQRAMLKLLPAMVCFDVYTQWVRLQRLYSSPLNPLIQPRIHQAMQDAARDGRPFVWPQERQTTIIIIEFALTAVYWMAALLAAWMWKGDERRSESVVANDKQEQRSTADAYQSTGDIASAAAPPLPSSLPSPFPSTPLLLALLLSSFGKFFALIPLVWASEYHHFDGVAAAIKTFVACSNVKAVQGKIWEDRKGTEGNGKEGWTEGRNALDDLLAYRT